MLSLQAVGRGGRGARLLDDDRGRLAFWIDGLMRSAIGIHREDSQWLYVTRIVSLTLSEDYDELRLAAGNPRQEHVLGRA